MWVRHHRGNVFVGNLPPDFADQRLAEAFDPYGIVLSATVARDRTTGARLRYGFVDIATERAASAAINALDGSEIDGCRLKVRPSERPAKKAAAEARPPRPALRGLVQPHRPLHPPQHAPLPPGEPPGPYIGGEVSERAFRPMRRKTPSFQVERRPLPRRI